MTDEDIVKYVEKCWKQHEDAMTHAHKTWKELWQLYQNKQDWSKKMGWQSKCFIPKIMMQVEKSAGEVKRAVLQTGKLFKFELNDDAESEQLQQLAERLSQAQDPDEMALIQQQVEQVKKSLDVRKSRMQMREKQFKRKLAQTEFVNVYSEMLKPCMLLGLGVPKLLWSEGLKFEHVDAMNFAISPDYVPYQKARAPFMIERVEMDLAEFKSRARAGNKGGVRLWKTKVINKIEEDAKKLDRANDRRVRKGYGDYSDVNKRVELKYYWGDLVDKDDKKVKENQLIVVANGKYLARMHDNPFDHQNYPYIPTIPMVYPHRGTHGVSLVAPQVRIQYTLNNIVNMVMDNLNFSIMKMFEYNPNDLLNPNSMNTMYPGKTIPVNTTGGQQAIREVVTSALKRDALYFYELIDRERQEGSAVTEFISGLPGKKSKTLGEVEQKTAESRGIFDTIGRDLEMNSLKPLLEMAYDLCAQFEGWEPRQGNYIFTVSGVTVMLQQRELSEKIGQALAMALQSPELGQMTDIADLWKQLLATHNLSDAYREPSSAGAKLDPQQAMAIDARASEDAKRAVAQMSPEEIERMAG
jgi:hypothetical protein